MISGSCWFFWIYLVWFQMDFRFCCWKLEMEKNLVINNWKFNFEMTSFLRHHNLYTKYKEYGIWTCNSKASPLNLIHTECHKLMHFIFHYQQTMLHINVICWIKCFLLWMQKCELWTVSMVKQSKSTKKRHTQKAEWTK